METDTIMEETRRATGFASPAQGYEGNALDFNDLLVKNPAATYVMELMSSDMVEKGLLPGSLLVIDRSVLPVSGSMVVLGYDGEFLCRQMDVVRGVATFTNGKIAIRPGAGEAQIFGVVIAVVRKL
jgi:DNA polymerase V